MSGNALASARALAAKAAAKELEKNLDGAFQLYLDAARAFLHIANTQPAHKQVAKAEASKAVERAEKIKHAKADVKPVAKDAFADDEQAHILRKSARINGLVFPAWDPSNLDFSQDAVFSDPDGQPQIEHPDGVQWRRLPNGCIHAPDLVPYDIVQTVIGNCSVVASLAACLQHHRTFGSNLVRSSLYPQDDTQSTSGKYVYKMLLNGSWRRIVIDDMLPVNSSTGTLLCASTGPKHVLWPSLVEKAYMKTMGGYAFEGSNSCIDLHALIGWIPEPISLNSPSFRKEQTWQRILDGFLSGRCLVTLGTGKTTPSGSGSAGIEWLIASHDYAVTDITKDGTLRVLDPLQQVEDDTSEQTRVHTVSWDEVCAHFETAYVSWDPKSFRHYKSVHGSWSTSLSEGAGKSTLNQHIRLTVDEGADDGSPSEELWILLSRHVKDKDAPPTFISVHALQQDHFSSGRDASQLGGAYTDSPLLLARLKLDTKQRHNYVVVASASGQGQGETNASFTFSIYSNRGFTLSHAPPKALHTRRIEGAFTSKTAGGSPLSATFMNNPQWALRLDATKNRKVELRLSVEGSKDLSLNVKAMWGSGKRITDISEGDVALDSGTYRYGLAFGEKSVQAGDYTVIVSSFKPKELGAFLLTVECSVPFALEPIPQEGSGMYSTALKGSWTEATAGGSPSSGRYHLNPVYDLHLPTQATLLARLQLASRPPNAALNITIFAWDGVGRRQVVTSGPYAEHTSGVLAPETTLPAGRYCLIPSTYVPGVCAEYRLVVYSSAAGIKATLRT
ncbi:cysteine proteinase [Exidia glandulosa HHB12029]|uniref:Cysteine proteinase n=1 Tax=Exidia glandulosa HHB12029 TaxID=1314781 RepID=A0A165E0Z6_EXIGL|nr:cysteine proteinase [Exidia glandulosa HHB12029]